MLEELQNSSMWGPGEKVPVGVEPLLCNRGLAAWRCLAFQGLRLIVKARCSPELISTSGADFFFLKKPFQGFGELAAAQILGSAPPLP